MDDERFLSKYNRFGQRTYFKPDCSNRECPFRKVNGTCLMASFEDKVGRPPNLGEALKTIGRSFEYVSNNPIPENCPKEFKNPTNLPMATR